MKKFSGKYRRINKSSGGTIDELFRLAKENPDVRFSFKFDGESKTYVITCEGVVAESEHGRICTNYYSDYELTYLRNTLNKIELFKYGLKKLYLWKE